MSIIPKISVGLPKKREKFSTNFDNSTTSNVGNIQPTMCREMVPGSKMSVGIESLVRLASMPLPSFGRVSLRHNHVFVPIQELWQPFDAMLAGQHYRAANENFIPTRVPGFQLASLLPYFLAYSDITIAPAGSLNNPLVIDRAYIPYYDKPGGNVVGKQLAFETEGYTQNRVMYDQMKKIQDAINEILFYSSYLWPYAGDGDNYEDGFFPFGAGSRGSDDYGVILAGDFHISISHGLITDGDPGVILDFKYLENAAAGTTLHDGNVIYDPDAAPISPEGADLIFTIGNWALLLKFKAPLKRLRTIFIGLGYQFSPYNGVEMSILKLLAYYKGWFALFRPDREKSFVDTNCYQLIKMLSEHNGHNVVATSVGGTSLRDLFFSFIDDLMHDCYYYLPMDYFGMGTVTPQQPNSERDFYISTPTGDGTSASALILGSDHGVSGSHDDVSVYSNTLTNGNLSPIAMRLAQRLLTFANKNTVVGRSIRNYLKVHYGVADVDPIDSGEVIRIGSSRVEVKISDVMSTAENSQGYLGEYGGKGIGYNKSDKFDFSTDKFGYWITYTVIVPESGYYQGYLKENRHLDRYEFFMPEWDAMGYQTVERGEIMDSYDFNNGLDPSDDRSWNPRHQFDRTGAFSLVPRYSEYKVGRNIVNGDLSIPGLKNSMSPYTLDRRIPSGLYSSELMKHFVPVTVWDDNNVPLKYEPEFGGVQLLRPDFIPTVVYDDFRRIDPTDHLGQYNRIFNYGLNDLDHFIIHNMFDVTVVAPMKSLSTSFDTYGEEDDTSIGIDKA